MVVAVIGQVVAITPLIDRSALMRVAIAALRLVIAVLAIMVAIVAGVVAVFVMPFGGIIRLLITMTPRGVIVAAITVAVAVIGNRGTNNGQCGDTRDNGGGFAPVLCLDRRGSKAAHGQGRADDENDELAMHGHSFQGTEVVSLRWPT